MSTIGIEWSDWIIFCDSIGFIKKIKLRNGLSTKNRRFKMKSRVEEGNPDSKVVWNCVDLPVLKVL